MRPRTRPLRSLIALAPLLAAGACATVRPSTTTARAEPATAAQAEAPARLRESLPVRDVSALGLYLAAETALEAGESGPAARYFARASAADPEDVDLRARAFTTSLLAGDVAAASRLAPAPGAGAEIVSLGRLVQGVEALASDRPKEATALLADPGIGVVHRPAASLLLPWAAAAAGGRPGAEPPGGEARSVGRFAQLSQARRLERAGQAAAAEPVFKRLAEAGGDPLFAEAYGGFLERRGRRAEAVAAYDAALAREPDSALRAARRRAVAGGPAPGQPTPRQGAAESLVGPAVALIGARRADLGLIYVRLALRLDPQLSSAWLVVGDTLNSAGEREAARAAYARVPETAPEGADALERLALAAQADGDKAGALRLARRAATLAPDDDQAGVVLAEVLRAQGRDDEAVAVLDPLVARSPMGGSAGRLLFLRGAAHERSGRWTQAEADLKRALQLRPDDPEVLNYLAFGWADRGLHLKEALAMLEKASAARPDQGSVLDSVGWARFRMGDMRGALRDLEKAVALEPADPEINDHLGDVYQRVGRRSEARYQWRRVLTLDPVDKVRAAVEAKLRAAETPSQAAERGAEGAPVA